MQTRILGLLCILAISTGCGSDPLQNASTNQSNKALDNGDAMTDKEPESDWEKEWSARLELLEKEFGKSDNEIATAIPPIYLGGDCDVLTFRNHVKGLVHVTAGLIGLADQEPTTIGQYELMICVREKSDWAPSLISKLARYTLETPLNPNDTMDIGSAMPNGSTIAALLFVPYREFKFNGDKAGVLLCLGVTKEELKQCRKIGSTQLLAELKNQGVFPFTDTKRVSVVK